MVWLDNARIIAMFAVVVLHTAAGVVVNHPIGSSSWWVGNLYDALVRWCVPVFVMISGALLLDPSKKEDVSEFLRKRLSRILLPLLAWSVFYAFWAALRAQTGAPRLDFTRLAGVVLSGDAYFHLWFLYMMVGLYLFVPFLRKTIHTTCRFDLAVLVLLLFAFAGLNAVVVYQGFTTSILFTNGFLSYLPYFMLGHLVRVSVGHGARRRWWSLFGLAVVLTALGCYVVASRQGLFAGLYFYDYLSVTVIPMSVSLFCLLKFWDKPMGSPGFTRQLSALTLGVYLIHPVFLETLPLATDGLTATLSIPARALVVFGLSAGTVWLISQVPYLRRVI